MEIFRNIGKEVGRRKLLSTAVGGVILFGVGGRVYNELEKPNEVELQSLLANPDKFTNKLIITQGYQGNVSLHKVPGEIDLSPAISVRATYYLHSKPDLGSPSLEVITSLGMFTKGDPKLNEALSKIDADGTYDRIQVQGVFKKGGSPSNVFYYINSLQRGGITKVNPNQ